MISRIDLDNLSKRIPLATYGVITIEKELAQQLVNSILIQETDLIKIRMEVADHFRFRKWVAAKLQTSIEQLDRQYQKALREKKA